jgi:ribosomal protein S1
MKKTKYSIEEYDQTERDQMEKLYEGSFHQDGSDFIGKDLENNSSVKAKIIKIEADKGIAIGETKYGQSVIIDLKKESKGMKRFGYPEIELQENQLIEVVVQKDPSGSFNGSLSAGFEKALKRELHKSIKEENCAFNVKVVSVCNGGFMVSLSGIECFLPGSLAAANRIMNFSDYIGKELTVMTEVYDQKRDIFVVSFKKYLNKIIDTKVQELSFSNKYEGTVTGVSNTGVFVEWDEIFTGIVSFDEAEREKISNYKSGDKVTFYVTDIKNPQRIALSFTDPNPKMKMLQDLKDSSVSNSGENSEVEIYKGEITKLKTFGAFVKLENGLTGLIEKEKLRFSIDQYEVGQQVNCNISSVDLSTSKIQLMEN